MDGPITFSACIKSFGPAGYDLGSKCAKSARGPRIAPEKRVFVVIADMSTTCWHCVIWSWNSFVRTVDMSASCCLLSCHMELAVGTADMSATC